MKNTPLRGRARFLLSAVLLPLLMISVFWSAPVSAAERMNVCDPLSGQNSNAQDYPDNASPVYSYLTTSGSGYMRVQGNVTGQNGTVVCYYDSSFALLRRLVIPQELPLFGGFYESGSNYFLVTGKANPYEDNSVEVFRVTKYDKNWKRLSSCSLSGANTYLPFASGSCRMAMDGKYLLIRTSHIMYTSSDGLNHQANATIEVDTSSMTVTDSFMGIDNPTSGYVSHSFNQFVHVDDHQLIAVDHGDSTPRAICLMIYPTDVSTGHFRRSYTFGGVVATTWLLTIQGTAGDNYTGASVGGFELSSSHYLVAGNSVVQDASWDQHTTRNLFVATKNRSTGDTDLNWITDYKEGSASASTPQLVPVSSTKLLLLWTRSDGLVYYTFLGADGTPSGKIYTMAGDLSDCRPLVNNGKVTWYIWKNEKETFYQIPVSSPDKPTSKTLTVSHDYQVSSAKGSHVTVKCSKCGDLQDGEAPVSFGSRWRLHGSNGFWNAPLDHLETGSMLDFSLTDFTYSTVAPERTFNDMEGYSSDPDLCVLDMDAKTVTLKKAGTYKLTFYPKYNKAVKQSYTLTVFDPLTSVKLTVSKESPLAFGSSVKLKAKAKGGPEGLIYHFTVKDSQGNLVASQKETKSTFKWTPESVGKYKLQVTAEDPSDSSKIVKSKKMSFTISKKSIKKAKVSKIKSVTYMGMAFKPCPSVTIGGKALRNTADYKLSYKNNVQAGKATVIIKGTGNYKGKITKAFYIKPAGTCISQVENASKKALTVKWAKAPSGTGYQVQYGLKKNFKKAKTITVKKLNTTSWKIKKLKKGKTYYLRVRVYKTVGKKTLYSKWSSTESIKVQK